MYRGNAPSRRGRLQKLNRNSDLVQSNSLANAFSREERNLNKKLQNLNTEKRLSLAQMDSEIQLYRKMNRHKIEKWEDNCDMSDVSEAGSDDDDDDGDIHVGYNTPCYDSNFKRKTERDPRIHNNNVNNLPSKYTSSFTRFTPFGSTRKVLSVVDMPKHFHPPLRETHSEPAQIEKFFSRRFRDIPRQFGTKESNTRPRSASGTQAHAKEIEDYNPRDRSMSIKHADFEHIGFSHGENQARGSHHHMGGHQATGLGGHTASGLSYHMGDHQATGMSHHMHGGHQAGGLSHLGSGYVGSGIGGDHKSIVHTRGLAHAEHHSGLLGGPNGLTLGTRVPEASAGGLMSRGINGPELVGMTREMHSHDFQYKTNKTPGFSVSSKFKNFIPGSKSLEKSDTSNMVLTPHFSADGNHTTSYKGPQLKHNSIGPSALPKQQSNTAHRTSDWVFQNSPPKHLGIPLHNPMLFHPRFHNNLGLVHETEANTESTDPNSFHVLKKCRYLRITQANLP